MTIETLEDYLAGDYHQDMDDVRALEETLGHSANVFIHSCDQGRWPYEQRSKSQVRRAEESSTPVSHGTQAMIAAALGKMCGLNAMPSGDRACLPLTDEKALQNVQKEGVECLCKSLDTGHLVSRTFGKDDPVTLSHVTDLVRGLKDAGFGDDGDALAGMVRGTIDKLETLINENPALSLNLLPQLPDFGSEIKDVASATLRQPDYVVNAFVPLRIVRSVKNLLGAKIRIRSCTLHPEVSLESDDFNVYRRYFESTLYDQLSFSAIPDSRFDAAELIFCLEGLMICGRHAIDSRVFEHVLHVLKEKQEISSQWRPNRPVFATSQGMTMLPVSVESAISLVRSVEIIDRWQTYHPFSRLAVPLARRFWHWLQARIVKFRPEGESASDTAKDIEFTGWHSEHVNNPGLIHLWDTSQVIEFMLGYREMLQRSIAGRTLLLSKLKIDLPGRKRADDWLNDWKKQVADFEPRRGQGTKVYEDKLSKDFVVPWGLRAPNNFSILLYGPPGTGKSSLAKNLAKSLGMQMITVTVSDFLGRGGANVETRAKAIFQTLEAQFNTVILFDEIDSFLLDRDSIRYGKQDSLFQFLTPGMLTKINDLRAQKRSIFIIATNYANRIDPAIKRRGRIDQRYLLQLPDAVKRLQIIRALRRKIKNLENEESVDPKLEQEVKELTLFFGFSDLDGLVKAAGKDGSYQDLVTTLRCGEYEPSTKIENYTARYPEENFPFDELFELAELRKEVEPNFDVGALEIRHGDEEIKVKFSCELANAVREFKAEKGSGDPVPSQNSCDKISPDRNGVADEGNRGTENGGNV